MPPWLRISICALLAGFCTGCGSGGLFWVDDKLSKLSAPPKTVAPTSTSKWKDDSESKPSTIAASKTSITSPRDVEDGAIVAPPKMTSAARSRAAELDPVPQKPLPTNEERIPTAFELATPRSVRGDRIPAFDVAAKRAVTADLNPSDDDERTKTPVTPASYQRQQLDEPNESDRPEASAVVRVSHREETTPSSMKAPEMALTKRAISEAPEKSGLQSAQANPIPRATRSATAKKLELANVALCSKILGFGKIDGTKTSLPPGGQALVYVEVSGRASKKTGAGVETRLNGKLRLTPKAGGPTMEWPYPNIIDVAPVERGEFFCFMTLQLPDSLSEGEYRLEVVVDDLHGGEAASEETSLRVERSTASTR